MLTLAEKVFLSENLSAVGAEQLMESVDLYSAIRTVLVSGISAANEMAQSAIAKKNAQAIKVNGLPSPLIVHGPHGYSPHRAGPAIAFHHEGVGQNIGDISYHPKKNSFTLNLYFGHGTESSAAFEGSLHDWKFYDEDSRRKGVIKDISGSSDLTQLCNGIRIWRSVWFT